MLFSIRRFGRRNKIQKVSSPTPDATPPPRLHFARRWFRRLLWVLVAFLFLMFFFAWLLTTPPVKNWLKERARVTLESALQSRVYFGNLDTNLLTHLVLHNVCLYPKNPNIHKPYLTLSELSVDYPTLPLLAGRWYIRRIHLGTVHIELTRLPSGRLNLPFLYSLTSKTSSGPSVKTRGFHVTFKRFDMDRLTVLLHDEKLGHQTRLDCRDGRLTHSSYNWILEATVHALLLDGQPVVEKKKGISNTIRAHWNPWESALEKSDLEFLGGQIIARGVLMQSGIFRDTSFEIHGANLSRFVKILAFNRTPLDGTLDASATFFGNPDFPQKLQSSGHMVIHPIDPSPSQTNLIDLRWDLQHGALNASLAEEDNDILFKANINPDGSLKGVLTASFDSLSTLTQRSGLGESSGTLAATGDLSGTLHHPKLVLQIDGLNLRIAQFPADRIEGHIQWEPGNLRFNHVRITGSERAFHEDQKPFGLSGLSGGVTYLLELDGPSSDPSAHLTADFKRPGWKFLKFDRAALRASLSHHRFRVDLFKGQRDFTVLQFQGQHDFHKGDGLFNLLLAEVKGSTSRGADFANPLPEKTASSAEHFTAQWLRKKNGGFDGSASCRDFNLAFLTDLAPSSSRMEGKLTTNLLLHRAGPRQPLSVTGQASLRSGLWRSRYDTAPVEGLQGEADWKGSKINLKELRGTIRGVVFQVKGSAALPTTDAPWNLTLLAAGKQALLLTGHVGPEKLDLSADLGPLPAGFIEPFLSFLKDISGNLQGKFHITGTLGSPLVQGRFQTNQLNLFLPVLNARLSKGDLNASLKGNRLVLDPSLLRFNDGPLTLSGAMAWGSNGLEEFNFRTTFSKAKVSMPGLMKGTLEQGWISWAMSEDGYLLSGDADLSEGRWLKPFKMGSNSSTPSELPDFLNRTRLSIRFRGSQNLWLDNNYAKILAEADAALTGTWGAPTLLGTFTAIEGKVLYLDRRFTVESGSANFNDATTINPVLSLQAAATVRSYGVDGNPIPYTLSLSISGPLDQMVLSLTSDPALSQSDIVSLLTLGATQQEIVSRNPQSSTSTGDVLLSRAGSLTEQTLADYSTRKVGQWIGLEDLSMQGDPLGLGGSTSGSSSPQISATTRITDKISVTYQTNTGSNPQRSVRIGYYLSNRFSIATQSDQTGQSSLDLKYRLLFK
jgi:hypothetical protein